MEAITVAKVDLLQFSVLVFEDLSERQIVDVLHPAEREFLQVRSHTADLGKEIIWEPVVILKVKSDGIRAENLAQVFHVKHCIWQAFQVTKRLIVTVTLETDVLQLLDHSPVESIFLRVDFMLGLEIAHRQDGRLFFSQRVHLLKYADLLRVRSSGKRANRKLLADVVGVTPSYCRRQRLVNCNGSDGWQRFVDRHHWWWGFLGACGLFRFGRSSTLSCGALGVSGGLGSLGSLLFRGSLFGCRHGRYMLLSGTDGATFVQAILLVVIRVDGSVVLHGELRLVLHVLVGELQVYRADFFLLFVLGGGLVGIFLFLLLNLFNRLFLLQRTLITDLRR